MRLLHFGIAFALATAGFADTITLKNGQSVNGTYLGGTARQVRVEVGNDIQTFNVSDIARIEFSGGAAASNGAAALNSDEPRPTLRRDPADEAPPRLRRAENGNVLRPAPPPPAQAAAAAPARGQIELPPGTNLVIRMIDGVDSDVASVGQTFQASLDEPVMIAGAPVINRGADVVVKLVDAKDSGKLTGRGALTLDLVSIKVDGRVVDINTQTISREGKSQTATTAKRAAGVGAVGAIIGAIAGGGKGAAIGAAAGGAAGAGSGIITGGEKVKIPSETRLTFVLDTPVQI